jgi:hypothetical protein
MVRPPGYAAVLKPHQLDICCGQLEPEFALDGGDGRVSQRRTDVLLVGVLRRLPELLNV